GPVVMCSPACCRSCELVFFFQAEDGIRDRNVTGVQTCALPISFTRARNDAAIRGLIITGAGEKAFVAGADIKELAVLAPIEAQRSEERRVGKECRSRRMA